MNALPSRNEPRLPAAHVDDLRGIEQLAPVPVARIYAVETVTYANEEEA
jgi:hypothetical protein